MPAFLAADLAAGLVRTRDRNSRRACIGRRAVALAAVCALAGCTSMNETGFSFASSGGQTAGTSSSSAQSQARFAKGNVILVAPRGYCIDAKTLRQDSDGGFALLPRCNFLQGSSWFGRDKAAVITATIGKATEAAAPSTADLARTAEGAKLLYYDDKGLLPLVRLQWHGHGATGNSGASADHWRGAFVLNGHLVVLALYAPEGSDLLGRPGADLLTEMTRRSQQASSTPRPDSASAATLQAKDPAVAKQTAHVSARPKTRPTMQPSSRPNSRPNSQAAPQPVAQKASATQGNSAASTARSPVPSQKRSLRKRIAAIFQ